ncbi:MAG: hypothetical protein HQK54_00530 [Oligoflexales bacterium]|nr:hypothetical protein [Oligoflexales bacterium]
MKDVAEILLFFFPHEVESLSEKNRIEMIIQKAVVMAHLPLGSIFLENLSKDPLMLQKELLDRVFNGPFKSFDNQGELLIFKRTIPLDYAKLGKLYTFLASQEKDLSFIGGDFFSYENYEAVNDDIIWVAVLSFLLNLLLFAYFCPSITLLIFLAIGTFSSYLSGLFALRMFYPYIYSLVILFTSTFIGFNNEYLVHFSGIRKQDMPKVALGIGSAIGTTLIGFAVLLFSKNEIVRQIAIVSIGGMTGFVLLMLGFQKNLAKVNYRIMAVPGRRLPVKILILLWILIVIVSPIAKKVNFQTDIKDFRYQTSLMERQVGFFENILSKYSIGNMYAVPVRGIPPSELWKGLSAYVDKSSFHPIQLYMDESSQKASMEQMMRSIREASNRISASLAGQGIRFTPEIVWADSLRPMNLGEYLDLWGKLIPLPYHENIDGNEYVFVTASKEPPDSISVSPVSYYNNTLTAVQNNMTQLFCVGLIFMFVYLMPLQKRLVKVLYIFLPLGLAVSILLLLAFFSGRSIHFIHIAGLSLVIGLALDYSSIVISGNFSPLEKSKVILTGLSTILTFGILIFVRHPVMRDLGFVVSLGCAVSLLVSIFFPLDLGERQ